MSNNGHFYINAKVNNASIRFVIDAGASDIFLSLSDAKKVGSNLCKLNYNRRCQATNGMILGARATLGEVENIIFKNTSTSINNASMGASLLGMGS